MKGWTMGGNNIYFSLLPTFSSPQSKDAICTERGWCQLATVKPLSPSRNATHLPHHTFAGPSQLTTSKPQGMHLPGHLIKTPSHTLLCTSNDHHHIQLTALHWNNFPLLCFNEELERKTRISIMRGLYIQGKSNGWQRERLSEIYITGKFPHQQLIRI